MKKKLLAALALACACAFSSFAFAGCSLFGSGSSSGSHSGSNGNDEDDQSSSGNESGDLTPVKGAKVSESEWKKAIAASSTQSFSSYKFNGEISYEADGNKGATQETFIFDSANKQSYIVNENKSYEGGKLLGQGTEYIYTKLDGKTVQTWDKEDEGSVKGEWEYDEKQCTSTSEAEKELTKYSEMTYLWEMLLYESPFISGSSSSGGTLSESYSLFAYDSKQGAYVAKDMKAEGVTYDFTLSIKNGYVVYICTESYAGKEGSSVMTVKLTDIDNAKISFSKAEQSGLDAAKEKYQSGTNAGGQVEEQPESTGRKVSEDEWRRALNASLNNLPKNYTLKYKYIYDINSSSPNGIIENFYFNSATKENYLEYYEFGCLNGEEIAFDGREYVYMKLENNAVHRWDWSVKPDNTENWYYSLHDTYEKESEALEFIRLYGDPAETLHFALLADDFLVKEGNRRYAFEDAYSLFTYDAEECVYVSTAFKDFRKVTISTDGNYVLYINFEVGSEGSDKRVSSSTVKLTDINKTTISISKDLQAKLDAAKAKSEAGNK